MTLTAETILLYLVALFLTVATLWLFLHATQTISPKQTDLRDFLVIISVVIPFVMLIYFGFRLLDLRHDQLRDPLADGERGGAILLREHGCGC